MRVVASGRSLCSTPRLFATLLAGAASARGSHRRCRAHALSRRVEKVVGYPPLSELDDLQRREFHEALLEAGSFEDLPGKWQAAIVGAEQNRPKLRLVSGD